MFGLWLTIESMGPHVKNEFGLAVCLMKEEKNQVDIKQFERAPPSHLTGLFMSGQISNGKQLSQRHPHSLLM